VDPALIDLCRAVSAARNLCFKNEQNYQRDIQRVQQLLESFRQQLFSSAPFRFVLEQFGVYERSAQFPADWMESVRYMTLTLLDEALCNAMVVSDNPRVAINISPSGICIDIDQGTKEFPPDFLAEMREKSENFLEQLAAGTTVDGCIQQMKDRFRTTIGYVPPNLDINDGRPFRGNGTTNMVVDSFFRVNHISEANEHHTVALHTNDQLADTIRFKTGDRSVLHRMYGPGEVPMSAADVDDIFGGGGFDIRALLP
jgi:hypothetical protein